MSEPLLTVRALDVRYGAVHAVRGVDLTVHEGEVVALVGANGAGKSTFLRSLVGLQRASAGSAAFGSLDLLRARSHEIARAGLVLVPEGRLVFPRFTLVENLVAGSFVSGTSARDATRRAERVIAENPILARRATSLAGQLSGGEQQMLVIQRALMGDPRMIMLDEPSMGLSPVLADQVLDLVAQLRRDGRTILLVEQNALGALEVADRVYALGSGSLLYSGTSEEMRQNPHFVREFLGVVTDGAEIPPDAGGS